MKSKIINTLIFVFLVGSNGYLRSAADATHTINIGENTNIIVTGSEPVTINIIVQGQLTEFTINVEAVIEPTINVTNPEVAVEVAPEVAVDPEIDEMIQNPDGYIPRLPSPAIDVCRNWHSLRPPLTLCPRHALRCHFCVPPNAKACNKNVITLQSAIFNRIVAGLAGLEMSEDNLNGLLAHAGVPPIPPQEIAKLILALESSTQEPYNQWFRIIPTRIKQLLQETYLLEKRASLRAMVDLRDYLMRPEVMAYLKNRNNTDPAMQGWIGVHLPLRISRDLSLLPHFIDWLIVMRLYDRDYYQYIGHSNRFNMNDILNSLGVTLHDIQQR